MFSAGMRLPAILLAVLFALAGCEGDDGSQGPAGPAGATGPAGAQGPTGATPTVASSISGVVVNGLSSQLLAGVKVTGPGISVTTDASGAYTIANAPVGAFNLTFTLANFTTQTRAMTTINGKAETVNIRLSPVAAVVVSAADATVNAFNGSVTLSASVQCFDGRASCGTTWVWTQLEGPQATPGGPTAASSVTYTFPGNDAIKASLFNNVLDDDLLISNGRSISDRMFVHGINPFSLEQGIEAKFRVTATVANGDTASKDVMVTLPHLPYEVSSGLSNVPVGKVVVVHGPTSFATALGGKGYTWSFAALPAGSALTDNDIADAGTQHPYFKPDVKGLYTLSVTDGTQTKTMGVIAGTWVGVITGIGADGKPLADDCTGCHDDNLAPDEFTSWRKSGHAHILTNNLNTSTSYGTGCFACHTVGYDTVAVNGGIDEAADFQSWLTSGLFTVPNAENWARTVANYPASARKANIQCENCHGPNSSGAHAHGEDSRISLKADVCASCHGEPLRHARFQQWQESGHNNQHGVTYGDAEINRPPSATSPGAGHCGRCHSSEGFRRWIKQDVNGKNIDLTGYLTGANGETFGVASTADYKAALVELGMTNAKAVSQTCATCHKVHNPGSTSSEPNNVILRIPSDAVLDLPGGFEASGLGRGGLCIACHNSRNGEANDVAYDWNPTVPTRTPTRFMYDGAVHASAQGDVVMGENAFFVDVGDRSPHSFITDSCVTCHMELQPPPADLSYNLSGTNHAFEATTAICKECHGSFNGGNLTDIISGRLEELNALLAEKLLKVAKAYVAAPASGGTIRAVDSSCVVKATLTDANLLTAITLGRSSGVTYNGTRYAVPTGTRAACGLTGLVEYDAGGTPVGLLIERPLASGVYAGQALVKSSWNIALIEDDGSEGIHNPDFAKDVLNATREVLLNL